MPQRTVPVNPTFRPQKQQKKFQRDPRAPPPPDSRPSPPGPITSPPADEQKKPPLRRQVSPWPRYWKKSRIPRHGEDEPTFGGAGDHKLIVLVGLEADATFKWVRKSDRDRSSGCLSGFPTGDILVIDGHARLSLNTGPRLECRASELI